MFNCEQPNVKYMPVPSSLFLTNQGPASIIFRNHWYFHKRKNIMIINYVLVRWCKHFTDTQDPPCCISDNGSVGSMQIAQGPMHHMHTIIYTDVTANTFTWSKYCLAELCMLRPDAHAQMVCSSAARLCIRASHHTPRILMVECANMNNNEQSMDLFSLISIICNYIPPELIQYAVKYINNTLLNGIVNDLSYYKLSTSSFEVLCLTYYFNSCKNGYVFSLRGKFLNFHDVISYYLLL